VLRSFPSRQRHDGSFSSQGEAVESNGAALCSLAEHWRMTRDLDLVDLDSVEKAARWIERRRHAKRRPTDPALEGLLPASAPAERVGPFDHYYYWDELWGVRGLRDAADLLDASGRAAKAAQARGWAEAMMADLRRSWSVVADRLGTAAIPAGPRRRLDPGVIGSLAACSPLGLLAADSPEMTATAELIRERFSLGPAFYQGISHTGLGTYLTLQLAAVELEAGDRRALDRLQWMLGAATGTFTWPEAIHPRLGGGCMGDGHHGRAAADFLSLVRNLLVLEVPGASCSSPCSPTAGGGSPSRSTTRPPTWGGCPSPCAGTGRGRRCFGSWCPIRGWGRCA
jgi:hypothetical protein